MSQRLLPVVVLISGSGSNLQSIIDAAARADLAIDIRAVISNKASAFGLERAQNAGIRTHVIDHRAFESREHFDDALMQKIDSYEPELVVLAGFMRILTPGFVRHYLGRLMNIHPSLLPKYQGLNTHQRALDAGDERHGATVHFVTEELDGGPNILQYSVPIEAGDNPESLAKRVLIQEHVMYPEAIRLFAEGRLTMTDNKTWLDQQCLPETGVRIDT